MVISYDWPDKDEEAPVVGTMVDVSGNPDRPVLIGVVGQVTQEPGAPYPTLLISIPDGQMGATAFQSWVQDEGNIGVSLKQIPSIT